MICVYFGNRKHKCESQMHWRSSVYWRDDRGKSNYELQRADFDGRGTLPTACLTLTPKLRGAGWFNKNPAKTSEQQWARNFSDVSRYTVYAWRRNEKHRDSDDVFPCTRGKTQIQRQGPGYLPGVVKSILAQKSSQYFLSIHAQGIAYISPGTSRMRK